MLHAQETGWRWAVQGSSTHVEPTHPRNTVACTQCSCTRMQLKPWHNVPRPYLTSQLPPVFQLSTPPHPLPRLSHPHHPRLCLCPYVCVCAPTRLQAVQKTPDLAEVVSKAGAPACLVKYMALEAGGKDGLLAGAMIAGAGGTARMLGGEGGGHAGTLAAVVVVSSALLRSSS